MAHPKIELLRLVFRRRGASISISQYEAAIDLTELFSLLCGIAVIVGLFMEVFATTGFFDGFDKLKKGVSVASSALVALGVAGEIYFGNLSGRLEKDLRHIITTKSDEKIAALEGQASQARERAAMLEQLTSFRHVPEDVSQLAEFLVKLNSQAAIKVHIDYQQGDSESFCYAVEIAGIFKNAEIYIQGIVPNSFLSITVLGLHFAGEDQIRLPVSRAFEDADIMLGVSVGGQPPISKAHQENLHLFVGSKVPPSLDSLMGSLTPVYHSMEFNSDNL